MKKAVSELAVGDKTKTYEVTKILPAKDDGFIRCVVQLNEGGSETRRFRNTPNNKIRVAPFGGETKKIRPKAKAAPKGIIEQL